MRLRDVRQLFDALDPSPFREKDLDCDAEEYIVESLKEFPSGVATSLVIYLDQPTGLADEERAIGDAVRAHFARRSMFLWRDFRRLIRRGTLSLLIGVAFLATLFAAAQLVGRLMGEGTVASLMREGLMIGGWVAMWRPLEIFLYDWWPILATQRTCERLSRIDVRVAHSGSQSRDELARILTRPAAGPTPVIAAQRPDVRTHMP